MPVQRWTGDCDAVRAHGINGSEGHTPIVHDELVHATRAQRGAHGLGDHLARVDVAHQLRDALRGVRALLEQDNRSGLQGGAQGCHPHPTDPIDTAVQGQDQQYRSVVIALPHTTQLPSFSLALGILPHSHCPKKQRRFFGAALPTEVLI